MTLVACGRARQRAASRGRGEHPPRSLCYGGFGHARRLLRRGHLGFLNGGSSWEYAQMAATFRKGFGETGLLIVVLALVKPLSPPGDLSGQLICGPIEA
jgi:hypothetical protein